MVITDILMLQLRLGLLMSVSVSTAGRETELARGYPVLYLYINVGNGMRGFNCRQRAG